MTVAVLVPAICQAGHPETPTPTRLHDLGWMADSTMNASPPTTPAKPPKLNSDSPLAWFRIVGCKRRSDNFQDAKNESHFAMICEILNQFDEHPEDIVLVSSQAKKIKLLRTKETERNASVAEMFTVIGTVRQLDEDIVCQWLCRHSDMTIADVMTAKRFDPDAPWQLYAHATALSLALKLPEILRNVEVWKRWSEARHALMKNCLATFKSSGGLLSSGQLSWMDRTFTMEFDSDEKLTKITHVVSGVGGILPKGIHITVQHDFKNFWSDADAVIKLAHFPGVKALSLFPKGSQPFGYMLGINTKECSLLLKAEVARFDDEYRKDLAKVKGSTDSTVTPRADIKKELATIVEARKSTTLEAARKKALENVQAKGKKRLLNFTK